MFVFRAFILLFFIASVGEAAGQSDSLKHILGKLGATADTMVNPQAADVQGNVEVIADSSIVNLERNNRGFRETRGYRVQIFLGQINDVKTERNKYLSLGLPYSAYMKQVVPDYALQIGDFPTRMELEKNLEIIRKHYPKAFAVVDIIEPPKFSRK